MRPVITDANILFPASLRDFLMRLGIEGVIEPRWTADIHDEWVRAVLRSRAAVDASRLARTRTEMDAALPRAVVRGYESLIPTLALPDPDDRHVLAAAITAGADAIVTFNLSDFPSTALAPWSIAAVHPDQFLTTTVTREPALVRKVIREQAADLRRPPCTPDELLARLERLSLPTSVAAIRTLQP